MSKLIMLLMFAAGYISALFSVWIMGDFKKSKLNGGKTWEQ